jgi:acyl-CoA dehydrogenase
MDFSLPEDLIEFKAMIYDFAANEVRPTAEERDKTGEWSPEIWSKMGAIGLLGLPYPEEYGGQGADCLTTTVATEAFAEGAFDGGMTLAWGAHTIIGGMPIVLCGTEEQKRKYVPKLATGEWTAGLGLTEWSSGSDAAGSMGTRAERKGDRYILNGSKMSTTSELIFEDMEVPAENMISKENSGFLRVGKATLEWERTVLVASGIGSLQALLDEGVRYAKTREQFKEPIIRFHAIQEKIAWARCELDAARLLLYRSARKKDQGKAAPIESSIAKLYTTEALVHNSYEMGQIHGGYGFIKEYPVERAYRDARLGTLGAGTSEVMRSIIAANM